MKADSAEKLAKEDIALLEAILDEGITRGSIAMKRAHLSHEEMVAAVRKLLRAELINAEGPLDDPLMIPFSTLSARPSQLGSIRRRIRDAS